MTARPLPPEPPPSPRRAPLALVRERRREALDAAKIADGFPGHAPDDSDDYAGDLVDAQVVDAVYRVHEDTSGYARFPWGALDALAGPMAPGEFWIVGARTGGGKTLFALNLWDALVSAQGRCGLYIGLEQTPMEMRIKWACAVEGVSAAGILAGKWPAGTAPEEVRDAQDRVQRHLQAQKATGGALRSLAHFCPAPTITADDLRGWTQWAVQQCGAEFVVVDHLNRLAHDPGARSSFDAHTHLIRTAKALAVEHGIVMLGASQVGRPNGDPLQRFQPPALHELRGGGTSEEEANAVLCAFRPLKPTVTEDDMKKVRKGLADEHTLYEPDAMAVRVLKHRLDGAVMGRQCALRVARGRIHDRPIREGGRYDV